MRMDVTSTYIANLPVGSDAGPFAFESAAGEAAIDSVDIDNLPSGIVTGSNLIDFPASVGPELRSSIALSLLAAQRVAANDPVIMDPDQWIDRHNTVLKNLNWTVEGGGNVNSTFDSINVAVHQAIIPFLVAAFGPAAAASTLILTALKQLDQMDQNSSWITLFDQQSRRFGVSEYQFSTVETEAGQIRLRMASARFDASYGRRQVLFFAVKTQSAKFVAANSKLSADSDLLKRMNGELKIKLAGATNNYIRGLPGNLIK